MKRFFSILMVPVVGVALSLAVPTAMAQEKKEDEKMAKKKASKKKKGEKDEKAEKK